MINTEQEIHTEIILQLNEKVDTDREKTVDEELEQEYDHEID